MVITMDAGQDADTDADPDSQKALLSKREKHELKKINAAKEKAHKRFEALLSIGSESEDISEAKTPTTTKQRQRTKTAEGGLAKLKQTPPKKIERSRSEESLLSLQDDPVGIPTKRAERSQGKSGNIDSIASVVDKVRKKKTKSKSKAIESATENQAFDKPSDEEDNSGRRAISANSNNLDEQSLYDDDVHRDKQLSDQNPEETGNQAERKKKKKTKKKKEKELKEYVEKVLKKREHDDGLLLCIVIHKADQVKPDARVRHPLIRLHLVNMETGEYIKKTDSTRNVTSMFENKNENENIDYILPLMTQPYDFKSNRTLTPHWDETLVYNEVYSYFLQKEAGDPPVIIFFELLDFMQMNLKQKEFAKTDKGWYQIAWAFLKVVSPCGITNTDHQVRVQFYQPLRRVRAPKDNASSLDVFHWWKYGSRIKYPSTLYVTVKGVFPPEKLKTTNRSMFPTQQERGAMSYDELNSTLDETAGESEHEQTPQMWARLPGQVNKIPNKLYLRLPSGQKGCSVVQFSNSGRYLACACLSSDSYPILIHDFPDGKLIAKFANHFGIVYDLCWSANGKELLSASADTTVRCWDTKRFASAPIKEFAHPCFVYACKYHPLTQSIVVTGAYDHVIRIWNKVSDNLQAQLLREVNEHKGFVNSIAFSNDGGRLFSADSVGVIMEWSCPTEKRKKVDLGEVVNRWQVVNTVQLPELKNTTLNTIQVHPGDCKLLVHSRDSMLRMLDLRSYAIVKTYSGGMNFKEHIHSVLSTCGSYVFCGTEYGFVHVWSTETGNLVHTYKELEFTKSVSHVHFHPNDNYVAFCSYGNGAPIVVYVYDPQVNIEKEKEEMRNITNLQRETNSFERAGDMLKSLHTTSSLMNINNDDRLATVNEKLMSVTAQSARNRVTFKESPRYESGTNEANETFLSTWGSDFTYSNPLSPSLSHTSRSEVNKEHPKSSSTPRKPAKHNQTAEDTTMTMSQLETPVKDKPTARKANKVIAMYDYHSTQTNQLNFSVNDVITIVGKGNADWGLGQLQDGREGYFPRTYVMEYVDQDHDAHKRTAKSSKSEGDMSMSYSAVVDRRGELKFISGNEDSDSAAELERSRRKRKQRRDRMQQQESDDNPIA